MKAEVLNTHTQMLAGLVLGGCLFLSAGARADMLYYLPFQDAAGNGTFANYGTVGGNATGTANYTNNTPPLVGGAYAHTVAAMANRPRLPDSIDKLNLTNSGDQITGMAYVYLNSYATVQGVVSSIQSGQVKGWSLQIRDTGKLTFVLGLEAGNIQRQSSLTLATQTWYHVAFSFTSGGGNDALKLYVDGTNVTHSGGNLGANVAAKNPNVYISVGVRDQDNWPLLGSIDEVRLYDEVLTQEQIQEIAFPPVETVIMIR